MASNLEASITDPAPTEDLIGSQGVHLEALIADPTPTSDPIGSWGHYSIFAYQRARGDGMRA